MYLGCFRQRIISSPLPPHLSSFHSGTEASVNVSAPQAIKLARGTIGKLFGLKWGRDGAHAMPASISPTPMLTQGERDAAMTWRARAAAELQSIREDGLLGRNWRKHPRTIMLLGYLNGTSTVIQTDNAARN